MERLVWVAMITSAENRAWHGDLPLGPAFRQAGLPVPSVIRACKLATIEADHAELLGSIARELMAEVLALLGRSLGLD